MSDSLIAHKSIDEKIYTVRGLRVMMDSDLAGLYGVTTTRLNEQVTRNLQRFPDTFMFQLTQEEYLTLISQNATSNAETSTNTEKRGGKRKLPRVFTERGVLMVANVLKSDRAIEVSIHVIEAFIRLKQAVLTNEAIMKKIEEIEARLAGMEMSNAGRDLQFKTFEEMILPLLVVNIRNRRKIGFDPGEEK